ncbi:hypothetical protein MTR_4g046153 [Medicago truncatula]|uniref:Uncharacterized protein n=1 Tax=Medicago truncatula TaxID=3880 RepID=A0A072UIN8_MEDTR|nr:hypothetical protein MTR_4g046153 [Medicago truncatula]
MVSESGSRYIGQSANKILLLNHPPFIFWLHMSDPECEREFTQKIAKKLARNPGECPGSPGLRTAPECGHLTYRKLVLQGCV